MAIALYNITAVSKAKFGLKVHLRIGVGNVKLQLHIYSKLDFLGEFRSDPVFALYGLSRALTKITVARASIIPA